MAFAIAMPWSAGEEEMQRLLRVPAQDNPTASVLTPQAAFMLPRAPLLAVGALDSSGCPWSTLWGGETGFSRPLGSSIIGIRTMVDGEFDPVVEALVGDRADGQVVRETGKGRMVGGLTIDLMARKRVKLYGRMMAVALSNFEGEGREQTEEGKGRDSPKEVQLVVRIEQSLGNCPKYLNKKEIVPAIPRPALASSSSHLSPEAIDLVHKADLFFVTSSNSTVDMDTNHRGGPGGFIRVLPTPSPPTTTTGTTIIWPEYSGNRLYQTLGNLQSTPLAGLCIPDFSTGDVLYATGTTEILIGASASAILPRSNLAVKLTITAARHVKQGLPFRGSNIEASPYNPDVRPLASEGALLSHLQNPGQESARVNNTARLVSKTKLGPTVHKYRFTLTKPVDYAAGQWVALDFSSELDIGYSHMRDDDPRSLNDDYIRTFTVSSPPQHNEFEVTLRTVGPVTTFLAQQSERSGLEVAVKGFGGEFRIPDADFQNAADGGDAVVPYVAGGVGITPLLPQLLAVPDIGKLRLFWTVRREDLGLVIDTMERHPSLAAVTRLFVTGGSAPEHDGVLQKLEEASVKAEKRRMRKEDLDEVGSSSTVYLCAGRALRKTLLEWLGGKKVVFEDFDY